MFWLDNILGISAIKVKTRKVNGESVYEVKKTRKYRGGEEDIEGYKKVANSTLDHLPLDLQEIGVIVGGRSW
jgi:hypothetical protein|tara:strand:+ start:507 stop:722 length:216 start_codon:yes stop_codon:yes gene_type:complete